MTTDPRRRPQSATSLSCSHLGLLFNHRLFVRCTGRLCVFCLRRCPEGLSQTVLPGGGRARMELGKDPRGLQGHLWTPLAGASRAVHRGLGVAALDCEPRLWLTSGGALGEPWGGCLGPPRCPPPCERGERSPPVLPGRAVCVSVTLRGAVSTKTPVTVRAAPALRIHCSHSSSVGRSLLCFPSSFPQESLNFYPKWTLGFVVYCRMSVLNCLDSGTR